MNRSFTAVRVVVGGLVGLLVFLVDVAATLIRFTFHPAVAERATGGAFLGMLFYLPLFVAAGAVAGYLGRIQSRSLRFALIGAIVGAIVWSYLTVTWTLTARPTSLVPPDMSAPGALLFGAGAGAVGGLLLLLLSGVRGAARRGR